jgi:hypothetical protein
MGVIRLLIILSKAGDGGLPTVELLNELGSTGYGQVLIKPAEEKGYLERREKR